MIALAAGQRLVRVVSRARRGNGRRTDQEDHDRRLGSQAARRLVALRHGWRRSRRSRIENGVRPAFISRRARSMVGDRRRNPRARQGADVKIGPAERSSFSRMQGSWFGIAGSRRIRGWQGAPCLIVGVHLDQHLALDMAALIRGFRAPRLLRRPYTPAFLPVPALRPTPALHPSRRASEASVNACFGRILRLQDRNCTPVVPLVPPFIQSALPALRDGLHRLL